MHDGCCHVAVRDYYDVVVDVAVVVALAHFDYDAVVVVAIHFDYVVLIHFDHFD